MDWERSYKWEAHRRWREQLAPGTFAHLIRRGDFHELAARAVRIESRTNLLFPFEKMAVRDAVRSAAGAEAFVRGLDRWLHGRGNDESRFTTWCECLATLPRRQTRVLTWPVATVFGFIAQPRRQMFLKPTVTQRASEAYAFDFDYTRRPGWRTYASLLSFARQVRADLQDLQPRDMIDAQSFIWVQGSDEY